MNIKQLSDKEQLIWASAILEGEGCFYIGHHKRYYKHLNSEVITESIHDKIQLSCQMIDKDVIENLQKALNIGTVLESKSKRKEYHKVCWIWRLSGHKEIYHLLLKIKPYLHSRRSEKISEIIHFLSIKYPELNGGPVGNRNPIP